MSRYKSMYDHFPAEVTVKRGAKHVWMCGQDDGGLFGIHLSPKDARAMAAELVKLADEIEGKDSTWKSDFSKISFHKPYYVKLKDGYECFGLWPCKDYLSCCEMCTITGNILHEIDGWGHEKAVSIDVVAFKEIDGVNYD